MYTPPLPHHQSRPRTTKAAPATLYLTAGATSSALKLTTPERPERPLGPLTLAAPQATMAIMVTIAAIMATIAPINAPTPCPTQATTF